jgi:hypothetical protein
LARTNKSRTRAEGQIAETAARRNFVRQCIGVYIHETLRSPSCSRARFRRVGLACRARLRIAVGSTSAAGLRLVFAKVRRNWFGMSLRGVRLQRRARLARSKWSVRVTR